MENYPLHLLATFQQFFPAQTPQVFVKSPDHEIWVAAALDDADAFHLASADHQARTTFTWQSAKVRQSILRRPLPAWSRFPAGVIWHLCAEGLDMPGLYAALLSTEAPGPRADYGTAMTVAALWFTLFGQPYTVDGLHEILERVRREYVNA
jgi:hypothetical protein